MRSTKTFARQYRARRTRTLGSRNPRQQPQGDRGPAPASPPSAERFGVGPGNQSPARSLFTTMQQDVARSTLHGLGRTSEAGRVEVVEGPSRERAAHARRRSARFCLGVVVLLTGCLTLAACGGTNHAASGAPPRKTE